MAGNEAYGYPYASDYYGPYGYGFYGAYPYGPSYGLGFSYFDYGYYRHRPFHGRCCAFGVPHGNFNNRVFVPPSAPPATRPSPNLGAMRSSSSFANAPSLRNGTMNTQPRMGGNMMGNPWLRRPGNR